ncbi:response regulator [Exiguobacterium sp. SL14]|nr:response regulator [Exiguobacterium sp. SL14]MCY1692456.1 response regulator [Exiguobacterium sp. SL14]
MPTLLIVDDEADIRQLLRLYLTNEGYEIIEAENGEEALAILATRPVDAMLLDVMMLRFAMVSQPFKRLVSLIMHCRS